MPDEVPDGTVLRVGDPATQTALEASGLDEELDVEVEWANITGGPKTLEAFRADAIDVGSVADIPPLFAQWTGTDIKIIAARETVDPLEHPTYELGVAPGVDVSGLEDLEGKSIAYSPGQAQGALVLRVLAKAGLTQDDVELVEMTSVDDAYVLALGSKQVDVAPLGQSLVKSFLAKYEQDGATTIKPEVRDDAWTLYTPTTVLQDADKAAALQDYVEVWARAQQWISDHPDEFAQAYYVEHEGLSIEDATYITDVLGEFEVPTSWDDTIARHQETADLLANRATRSSTSRTSTTVATRRRSPPRSGAASDRRRRAPHDRQRTTSGCCGPACVPGAASGSASGSVRSCCSRAGASAPRPGCSTSAPSPPRGPWCPRPATSSRRAACRRASPPRPCGPCSASPSAC